jgi:hypothetical protein
MWIQDHCSISTDAESQLFTSSADLYKSYARWALDMGHRPMSSKSLADRLRERGLSPSKKAGQRGWSGIQLRG